MTTLHIIPLQLSLHSDNSVSLVCDDPRATYDSRTGRLTINIVIAPNDPNPSQHSVRFVVRDPSPTDTRFYATMFSGYNAMALVHWHKDGDVTRSPYIPVESNIEVWSAVLAIPADPKAGKVYKGRSLVKIATKGAGDDLAIENEG